MKETLREKLKRVVRRLNSDIEELYNLEKFNSDKRDYDNALKCLIKLRALESVKEDLQRILSIDE